MRAALNKEVIRWALGKQKIFCFYLDTDYIVIAFKLKKVNFYN